MKYTLYYVTRVDIKHKIQNFDESLEIGDFEIEEDLEIKSSSDINDLLAIAKSNAETHPGTYYIVSDEEGITCVFHYE